VATTCYNIAADHYSDRSSNRQEKIRGPCKGPFFYLIFTTDRLQPLVSSVSGLLRSAYESYIGKLHRKVTCKSYIEKLHLMLAL